MIHGCTRDFSTSSLDSLQQRLSTTGIVIPTYNAGKYWPRLRAALDIQGIDPRQILIVDSSSVDGTDTLAEAAGYRVIRIPKSSFRHGETRQMATNHMQWAETFVFFTQDAIPCDNRAVINLIAAFDDPDVGAAYGRQLPREGANAIEAHARFFNYPAVSEVRSFASRETLGFRATFLSNSFAAYRRLAFNQVGGFPEDAIMLEDMTVAARMLLANWKVAYCADAQVHHSHSLNIQQEFSRYFSIAVHHARESWIFEEFGHVGGEGTRFLLSEFRYLLSHAPHLIPLSMVKSLTKWLAYQAGLHERHLPMWSKRALSSEGMFWEQPDQPTLAMTGASPLKVRRG